MNKFFSAIVLCCAALLAQPVMAQTVFAVEFKTGPRWDKAKQAHEQAHFADHSANLKKLREQGRLLIGARYADKGLLLITAESAEELRLLIEADPAVVHQVFVYDIHPFNVFYPGCVALRGKTC